MVVAEIDSITKPGAKKPPAVDLFRSVVLVIALMRRNIVQAAAANIFNCSQPTVSRRWDLLGRLSAGRSPHSSPTRRRCSNAGELPW